MDDIVLRLEHITKRFGPLVANDDVSLELRRGEVLALLGENGAGKSTLVSILFGHYEADAGRIEAFGEPLPPGQPRAALRAGIGMVHQHSTLADNLSVLDNVMLGTEPWWRPWSARRAARAHLLATAERFGLEVQPDARVAQLSVGERQRVELLKALVRGARILILDEPTAVLTPQESEALFATLGQMVAQGLAIVFISHKLAEVLRVSHRVAVMRQGRLVAECAAAQTTQAQLALWMVGHPLDAAEAASLAAPGAAEPAGPAATHEPRGTAAPVAAARPVCELRRVSCGSGRGRLHEVSLVLGAGEIVAVAGVSGNGQQALADLLCGMRTAEAGELLLDGRAAPQRVSDWVAHGVARIPEDRHALGVVGDLPVWENAVSERLRRAPFSRPALGQRWLRRREAQAHAARIVADFDVRGAGLASGTRALSGGNMQKLILGRALRAPDGRAPVLIVAHQPTWGLDIGAVAYVHRQLRSAAAAGSAVLLISDDLDEVLALGQRVAVIHHGRLTRARPKADWRREQLGLAMAGAWHEAEAPHARPEALPA